ncbi:MAG: M6 family metalloprotease domain-containing protein [Bacteroidia bacterium]|nr:M6 family metalloprotease domain-containing protein [Bacteroidia bacterium]
MKRIFLLSFSFLLSLTSFAQRSNCGVYPEPNTITQTDGSTITLVAFGNEQEHYLETITGYTVLVNANGILEYAYLDKNGNLSPSGIKATNADQFMGKNSFTKHLRYSKNQQAILAETFTQLTKLETANLGKAGPKGFPAKGIRKVCVLLIEYPDLRATVQKSVIENLFNQTNYTNTGCFREYYQRTSFGQLTLNSDVYGWYMADMNYINYGKSNANYSANTRDLVRDAVVAADSAGVDFAQYDNDQDGKVDGLVLLHAGIGAEEQSAPNANNYIWSFRSTYFGSLVTNDGKSISSFCFFPEKRYNNASYSTVGIGVMTHEFGHILDLPDLYSTQSNGEGSGNFTNMAGGPWLNGEKTPCLFDAWSRMVMEWHEPTLISQNGTYTIPKALADSNFSFRINTTRANEFFLLENRQLKGNDRYIPGRGLAIWHINTNTAKLLSGGGGNNVNNDTARYGTGLMQADGLRNLERGTNRGDAGDLYPGSTNNRNFNNFTNPSSDLHPTTQGVRTPSNVTISNITVNPDSSITFSLGNKPFASFSGGATSGCVPYTINFKNNSQFANNYKWNFGDGSTEVNDANPTYTFTTAGTYTVKLYVLDSLSAPIDSITQNYLVNESPLAMGSITRLSADSFYFENKSTGQDFVKWRFGTSSNTIQEPFGFSFKTPGKIDINLIAYKSNCTDTFTTTIDIWNTSVIEAKLAENISIYPNPFAEEINVSFEGFTTNLGTLSVQNILGQEVYSQPFTSKKGMNNLNLNLPLANGIYFIKLNINNQLFTQKVLKNKF